MADTPLKAIPRSPMLSKRRALEEVDIPDPKAPLKPHAPSPPPRLAIGEEIDSPPLTMPARAIADARAEPPVVPAPAPRSAPTITLSTTVEHRGRLITITATELTADAFCDLLDRRGFGAPAPIAPAAAPLATSDDLPDGWKLCHKHGAPMRPRNKQGDTWHSHNIGTSDAPVWCKGYRGADSPGYEL